MKEGIGVLRKLVGRDNGGDRLQGGTRLCVRGKSHSKFVRFRNEQKDCGKSGWTRSSAGDNVV